MYVEVTSIISTNDRLQLQTEKGLFEMFGVAEDRGFYIHVKAQKCVKCRRMLESFDRIFLFEFFAKFKKTLPQVRTIHVINSPIRKNIFAAIVKFDNNEEIVMIPSDAIAFACTQGEMGKNWHLYVTEENIERQTKQREQEQKLMMTRLGFAENTIGFEDDELFV